MEYSLTPHAIKLPHKYIQTLPISRGLQHNRSHVTTSYTDVFLLLMRSHGYVWWFISAYLLCCSQKVLVFTYILIAACVRLRCTQKFCLEIEIKLLICHEITIMYSDKVSDFSWKVRLGSRSRYWGIFQGFSRVRSNHTDPTGEKFEVC